MVFISSFLCAFETFNAERGGVVNGGGVVGHAARVGAAVSRRQLREHQQRKLVQALLLYLDKIHS